jgi:hypothetical protein
MKHDEKAAGESNIKAARHIDFVQFGGSGQITLKGRLPAELSFQNLQQIRR